MNFEKPPPSPMNADNPVYFNLPDGTVSEARVAWDTDVIDVANSLATLDKLVEKQMSKPNRPKKRLSLKRLFSGGKVGANGEARKEEVVKIKEGEVKDSERSEVCTTPSGEDENQNNQNTEVIAKTTPSLGKRGLAKLMSLDLSRNFLSGKEPGERGVKTPTTPTPVLPETAGAKSNSKPSTPILARGPKAKWYYNVEDSPSTPRRRAVSTEHLEKVAPSLDASAKPPVAPSTRAATRKTTSPSKIPPSGKRRTRSGSSHSRAGESPRPTLGLDAGPVHQLHASCRGFKASEQPDVVVLYAGACETSVMWKNFFCKEKSILFGANLPSLKISGQKLEDLYDCALSWRGANYSGEECVRHAQLQLVIVSPGLLQCVAAHTTRPLGRLIHASSVVGLMLGVAASDMTPGHLTGLQHFPQWTLVEITSEHSSDKVLGQVHEESQKILEARARENKSPSEPIFKLFPRKVNPGQAKLLVILDEAVSNKTGISALFSIDDTRVVVEEHKWIADNIIQIEAPIELFSTSAMANVFLYHSGKNSGVRQLKVETHLKMIELAWQSATEPVPFFSQVFNVKFSSITELDAYLSNQLDQSLDIGDLDLRVFPPSRVTSGLSDSEHPTLLHFAAHHGLVRLTSRLLAGGFAKFLDTPNCHGLSVVELAERAGHSSLAATLKEIGGPQHEYDYPNMSAEQNNSPEGTDTSLDGYLIPNRSSDEAKFDTAFVFDMLKPTKPSLPPKTTLHPIQEKYPESDSKPVSPDAVSPDNLSNDKSLEDLYDVPKHHDVIYAVPPSPVPVLAAKPTTDLSNQSQISDETMYDTLPLSETPKKSEPGQKRKSRLNNYIPMNIQDEKPEQFLPMVKTTNSNPKTIEEYIKASQDVNLNPFPLPKKASSFSEFTQPSQPVDFIRSSTDGSGSSGSSRPGSGLSREVDFHEGRALSREELIGKYCKPPDIPPRPDSTPPNFTRPAFSRIRANSGGSGRTRSDSECNVGTPKRCDSAGSATYKDFLKKLADEKNKSCSTPAGTSPDTSQVDLLGKSPAHVFHNGVVFLPDVYGDDGKDELRDIIQYFKDGKISASELEKDLREWKERHREAQIKTIRVLLEEAGLDGVIKHEDVNEEANKPLTKPSTPGVVTKLFTKISPSTSKTGSIRVRKKSAPDIRNVTPASTPEGGLKSLDGHYGSLVNLSGRQSAKKPTPPPEPARPLPPKTCQPVPPPAANLYDVPRKLSVGSSFKVDSQNNSSPARPVGRMASLKSSTEGCPTSPRNRSLPRVDRRDQSQDGGVTKLREDYVDHFPVSPKGSSSSHNKSLIPKTSEAVLLNANQTPRNNNIGAYENDDHDNLTKHNKYLNLCCI